MRLKMNRSTALITEFKYLGHIILHDFRDDADIDREIRNMFLEPICWCVNLADVQLLLKSLYLNHNYCLNMYDSALWYHYTSRTINRLDLL